MGNKSTTLALFGMAFGMLALSATQSVAAVIADFEGLPDSTALTTQIAGITFTNAKVLTAGISLNEFEFPPRSGTNVVFDDGGPVSIVFDELQSSVAGYLTYVSPVTLSAFDDLSNLLGTVSSSFSSNIALSGDAGSSPNELLELGFASGIKTVTIRGDLSGASFTLDDLSATPVPEPSTLLLLGAGLAGLVVWRSLGSRNPKL